MLCVGCRKIIFLDPSKIDENISSPSVISSKHTTMSESSDTEQEIVNLTDSPIKVSDTECISTVF